ncbi:MAG: nucleoside triphosphate pyrophosphohydrolase [Gammaproteobacteria bacterium]|nr:nucleoside triphosphate pyrophosphohydrolase [Gammaproteobacteria bacterium]
MASIDRLLNIMARLRDPQQGCPWDKEQTFNSILPHTLEEAYEVADAIERRDLVALREELGDLLFQVVFYAQLAREQGQFDFNAIVTAICDKLERRHPHVFGETVIDSAAAQNEHWENLKAQERKNRANHGQLSVLDGVARTLPALTLAQKIQKRAARVGFDWSDHQGVVDKVHEELREVHEAWDNPNQRAEEMGDLLFACVNLARHAQCDAETVLRAATQKFEQRFRAMEQHLTSAGQSLESTSIDQMEILWQQVKREQHT